MVSASGSGQPEAGIDCDRNTFIITGGAVIGTGGSTSSPMASASTQAAVICNGISATTSTVFNISDPEGNTVVSSVLPCDMGSMCVLVSAPLLVQGTEYSASTGGSVNGAKSERSGYYEGGSYSGGTTAASFTQASSVTTIGNGGNDGWRPDRPGDNPGSGRL